MKSPLLFVSLAFFGPLSAYAAPSSAPTPPSAVSIAVPAMAPQDDAIEPPARYVLQINGKPVPMQLDKEISLNTKAARTRFQLSREATRQFDKSGLKFDYPADYGFEADLRDPKIASWTLSGRSTLLMLQRFPLTGPALLREQMSRELIAQYGAANVIVRPTSLVLDGRVVDGKRLRVSLAKQSLMQELFAFSNAKYAFLLMIQDTSQNGKETDETRALKALLTGTSSY